mmetsp:Transcript_30800/g.46956  ORF Transcript_30800/g.46956 Transcript_30800/m.46956 type:complete len:207 (+) Transcript_30800:6271-6891(+)
MLPFSSTVFCNGKLLNTTCSSSITLSRESLSVIARFSSFCVMLSVLAGDRNVSSMLLFIEGEVNRLISGPASNSSCSMDADPGDGNRCAGPSFVLDLSIDRLSKLESGELGLRLEEETRLFDFLPRLSSPISFSRLNFFVCPSLLEEGGDIVDRIERRIEVKSVSYTLFTFLFVVEVLVVDCFGVLDCGKSLLETFLLWGVNGFFS